MICWASPAHHSGLNLCVDVDGGTDEDGANVHVRVCSAVQCTAGERGCARVCVRACVVCAVCVQCVCSV
jgi:hypothetical protein